MDNEKYVRMVLEFINNKYGEFYSNRFKEFHVLNYCINMSDIDSHDIYKISHIVSDTLRLLLDNGYLVKFKHSYMTVKRINMNNKLDIKCKIKK